MPVSHLGLTVSHIPSSTSFYLAALAPLGYRFIGQRGDSIGLGIEDADFFLSQDHNGGKISPTHIAFSADERLAVRSCYTAALNAGGRPSGAPGYVAGDCGCFNAAVIDLDGNTIEFIHREPKHADDSHASSVASGSAVARDDTQSIASKTSRAQSRAQTALDLASNVTGKRGARAPSSPDISPSRTEPVTSGNGGKNIVGTLLGAAAGAAVAYAMVQSERDGARDEAEYARSRAPWSSRPPSSYDRSMVSRTSGRRSKSTNRGMLAIEQPRYSDVEFDDVLPRYASSRRPAPARSRTLDAIEYAPKSTASRPSDRYGMKRASTLPNDPLDYSPRISQTAPTLRHTSRRGSLEDDSKLKRHDSAVSVGSRNPRRSINGDRYSSTSKASTIKPAKRSSTYDSAANIPLPSSKASSYVTAADDPLPSSRAKSYTSARQQSSSRSRGYLDSANESDGLGDTRTVLPEDSISCVDFSSSRSRGKGKSSKTSPRSPNSRRSSEKGSQATAFRGNPTASKYSAQSAPGPERREEYYGRAEGKGKRSHYSYA